jgi:nitrile hydratase
MNGMHDVGGMDGFGPVVVEKNEPVFNSHAHGHDHAED